MPKRIALIGLGNQGQEHLKAALLADGVELVAVVDRDVGRFEQIRSTYPQFSFAFVQHIQALREYALDGLVLALPHHCYTDVWQDILGLGLPLLKEKPLGRTLEEARLFLEQARASGCPLQTAIQRRHHPSYQALKRELLDRKAKVVEAHAHLHLGFPHSDDESWRGKHASAGGGVLLDSGYHLVDLVHYLVGPFDLVSASLWRRGMALSYQEIEDEAHIVGRSEQAWITLESRLTGEPDADCGSGYRKSEGIRLLTDQGLFFADRQGVYHGDVLVENYAKEWTVAMTKQLNRFADNIRLGRWDDLDIWDQLPSMQLIEQAYKLAYRY